MKVEGQKNVMDSCKTMHFAVISPYFIIQQFSGVFLYPFSMNLSIHGVESLALFKFGSGNIHEDCITHISKNSQGVRC